MASGIPCRRLIIDSKNRIAVSKMDIKPQKKLSPIDSI